MQGTCSEVVDGSIFSSGMRTKGLNSDVASPNIRDLLNGRINDLI